MKTELWVIWFALLVAVGFTAFEFGGFFPARRLLERARQDGWDEGFDRGFPHGARANGIDPDEWLPAEPQWQYGPRWDDTVEDLMQRGRSYYEPLARGAGANLPPVTRAPWQGETDGDMTLKGDSPGPGHYPTIFDELAASWPMAGHSYGAVAGSIPAPTLGGRRFEAAGPPAYETSAPAPVAGPPPGDRVAGAEPEPPAPEPAHESQARGLEAAAGAGADPWQQITAPLDDDPELNEWSIRAERARCHEITRELRELGKALSKPFDLTPWKGATA